MELVNVISYTMNSISFMLSLLMAMWKPNHHNCFNRRHAADATTPHSLELSLRILLGSGVVGSAVSAAAVKKLLLLHYYTLHQF